MSELKPCPFCGGKARMGGDMATYWITCGDCGATIRDSLEFGTDGRFARRDDVRAAVFAAWNTRAEPSP